jgi:hypothetical protein
MTGFARFLPLGYELVPSADGLSVLVKIPEGGSSRNIDLAPVVGDYKCQCAACVKA